MILSRSGLLLLLVLATLCACSRVSRQSPLYRWEKEQPVQPHTPFQLTLALKLRNQEQLHDRLMEVSDPTSPKYGQHYSKQEVETLVAPSAQAVADTMSWIRSCDAGAAVSSPCGGSYLVVDTTVKGAACMFALSPADFSFYSSPESDRILLRTESDLEIPESLDYAVDLVIDVNDFPYLPKRYRKTETLIGRNDSAISFDVYAGDTVANVEVTCSFSVYSAANVEVTQGFGVFTFKGNCSSGSFQKVFEGLTNYVNLTVKVQGITLNGTTENWITYASTIYPSEWITPELVSTIYGIPPGTVGTNSMNSQAVAEFDKQYYSPDDLSTFSSLMGRPEPNVILYGPNNSQFPGGESTLDIQWVTAVGVNVPTYFWSMENGFLFSWVISLCDAENPPFVNSISYGVPESDIPAPVTDRLNSEFQLLGMRGVTLISTAGDLGDSDGTKDCTVDEPDYPSSSPYTTSLGASYLFRDTSTPICSGNTVLNMPIKCAPTSELPCAADAGTGFTTGGGFSNRFPRPEWQDEAVSAYLNSASLPPSNYFNSSGRGFNDVGALGYNILVYLRGQTSISGGTSASGPIFCGVVGLLNDARLNAGKSTLGFMNPFLYNVFGNTTSAAAFNQVLSGNNRCQEVSSNGVLETCCEYGFTAQEGWNPLTGLGTPVFSVLREAALELQ